MSNNDAENKLPPEPAHFHFSIAGGKWSEAYVTVKDYERLKEFCLSLMKPRPKAIR